MINVSSLGGFAHLTKQPLDVKPKQTAAPHTPEQTTKDANLSGPKSFPEVAKDARAFLDNQYAKHDGVNTFDYRDKTGQFEREIFAEYDPMNLDRRMLYAIASNEGMQFTKEEIALAESFMRAQVQNAVYGSNPQSKTYLQKSKDYIDLLDNMASPEEKSSFKWIEARATAQYAYEFDLKAAGKVFDREWGQITNPLVLLLTEAHNELRDAHETDMKARLEDQPSYLNALHQWQQQQDSFGEYTINMLV